MDDALKICKEALGIFEHVHKGRDNEDMVEGLFWIGGVSNEKGDEEEAIKVYRELLSIQETLFGEGSIKTTLARGDFSMMLDKKGEEDEGLRLDKMNLEIIIECLGKDHPDTATSINNIGVAYFKKVEYEKALNKFQSGLLIDQKVYGNDHSHTKDTRRYVDLTTSQI